MKSVLFLDFDGVLNTPEFTSMFGSKLNPNKVKLLWDLIVRYDCNIVLSTAWRSEPLDKIKKAFGCHGFRDSVSDEIVDGIMERIIGVTDDLCFVECSQERQRELEILAYVSDNDIERWIAVDDMQLNLGDNFVRTNEDVGLTEALVERIINKWKS